MIAYEYNILEQRWEFIYIHHDDRRSHVYLKPNQSEVDILKNLINWFNQILRLRNEASS